RHPDTRDVTGDLGWNRGGGGGGGGGGPGAGPCPPPCPLLPLSSRCCCGARRTRTGPAPGTCWRRSPVSGGRGGGRGGTGGAQGDRGGEGRTGGDRGGRGWGWRRGTEQSRARSLTQSPEISRESPGSSQCLLEYLLKRLQSGSCRVKLKVLKILLHTCAQGSPQFVLQLKRNAAFIREAAAFTGPPDPLHGNSLNQKVRAAAQDLASVLFSDAALPTPAPLPARPLPPAGMGSKPSPCSSLQGFGFSSERSGSGSAGEALLSTIQRAAEAVANAVLPTPEAPRPPCRELHEDSYQPVRAPSPSRSSPSSARPPAATTAHSTRASHQPGLAGGGWEEADSGHSSQDSSQDNADLSRASDSYSKSGSDSHSGASRDLANGAERCGLLNCEVVLELLSRALQDPSDSVRMRSMCAISSLMCSDLLALDQIFAATQQHLQQLSQGSPGPVANRATK
uniref:TEPSIN adaptor related protein complex 4 accessory protein n=1 Tax=Anas platyrhynchos platyrhynchos TaxID=8840 RepID=A0A493U4A8_ANAPP